MVGVRALRSDTTGTCSACTACRQHGRWCATREVSPGVARGVDPLSLSQLNGRASMSTRILGPTGAIRRRRRLSLSLPLLLAAVAAVAFAISGSAVAQTTACNNTRTLGAAPDGSAFEIDTDANLIVNTTGCIDWLTGGTGTAFRSGVLAKNDSADWQRRRVRSARGRRRTIPTRRSSPGRSRRTRAT